MGRRKEWEKKRNEKKKNFNGSNFKVMKLVGFSMGKGSSFPPWKSLTTTINIIVLEAYFYFLKHIFVINNNNP